MDHFQIKILDCLCSTLYWWNSNISQTDSIRHRALQYLCLSTSSIRCINTWDVEMCQFYCRQWWECQDRGDCKSQRQHDKTNAGAYLPIQVLIDLGLSMAILHFYVTNNGVPLSRFGKMDSLTSLNSLKYIHHPQKQPTSTWDTTKLKQQNSSSPFFRERWLKITTC